MLNSEDEIKEEFLKYYQDKIVKNENNLADSDLQWLKLLNFRFQTQDNIVNDDIWKECEEWHKDRVDEDRINSLIYMIELEGKLTDRYKTIAEELGVLDQIS